VFAVLIVIGVSGYFVFSRNTNEITKQTCFPGNNLCYQVPINWQVTYTPASDLIPATQEITSSNTTKERPYLPGWS